MSQGQLKSQVKDFWNQQSCGTSHTDFPKLSREYFNEIERVRYQMEPEILQFAGFAQFRAKSILEIGVGAGTDFVQWVRGGAKAHGIDLTEEALVNTSTRLQLENLAPADLRVADCENLPYPDDSFDLVYSWGVIHHTPDTEKAFREIVRVCRPGGTARIMINHRHSFHTYYTWFRNAFLKLRPWKSLAWCLAHCVESPGTKAYLPKEVRQILSDQPIANLSVTTKYSYHDYSSRHPLMRALKRALGYLMGGDRVGWFLLVEFEKRP